MKRKKPRAARLSVSSNGSNGLRPSLTCRPDAPTVPFSILERIEWAATLDELDPRPGIITFSILERIEWAATRDLGDCQRYPSSFQYPRTDRMGCDTSCAWRNYWHLLAFSILERIEWAATTQVLYDVLIQHNFQYPRTDRMGCDRKRE